MVEGESEGVGDIWRWTVNPRHWSDRTPRCCRVATCEDARLCRPTPVAAAGRSSRPLGCIVPHTCCSKYLYSSTRSSARKPCSAAAGILLALSCSADFPSIGGHGSRVEAGAVVSQATAQLLPYR
ncbi:hypothetical protein J6590_010047 [Homalodisca vitripennis]|nr:hypothetical protein J6590_010047 [Homalodisca vitripennis]